MIFFSTIHFNAYRTYIKYFVFLNFISGANVHACRKSGRYLVAYEANKLIFKNLLQPLWEFSSKNPVVDQSSQPPSLEKEDEPPCKVARKSRLST